MNVQELVRQNIELRALCRRTSQESLRLKREVHDMQQQLNHLQGLVQEKQKEEVRDQEAFVRDLHRLVEAGNGEIQKLRAMLAQEDYSLTRLTVCIATLQKKTSIPASFDAQPNREEVGSAKDLFLESAKVQGRQGSPKGQTLFSSLVDELQYTVARM